MLMRVRVLERVGGGVGVCVCVRDTHTHTHQIYEIVSTHKHGIIELSVHAVQPAPPDEGGQQPARQQQHKPLYRVCVDNTTPYTQNTHTTDRPTDTDNNNT